MKLFRLLLLLFTAMLAVYTGIVVVHHGWVLFSVFTADIAALNWPGQFNLDFTCYLILSAIWMAWRHGFSPGSLVMAIAAAIIGIMIFAPYLLYISFQAKGDVRHILLGTHR